MQYRKMIVNDAGFLKKIFSIQEYDLYFAENETSVADWEKRIPFYKDKQSMIVSDGTRDVGWVMYRDEGPVCFIDIIVLLPDERHKGYGKAVLQHILDHDPKIQAFKLDVQQRNHAAVDFHKKMGFRIVSEEYQPCGETSVLYYNMQLDR